MKEADITIYIPRASSNSHIIKDNLQLIDSFFAQCRSSYPNLIESDLQSFFDIYAELEKMQMELASSQWANLRDQGRALKDILTTIKNDFDELNIIVDCKFDFDHIEVFSTFDQIRTLF